MIGWMGLRIGEYGKYAFTEATVIGVVFVVVGTCWSVPCGETVFIEGKSWYQSFVI